jgi:glycosyltransferase involved in cell wall biosynthesis
MSDIQTQRPLISVITATRNVERTIGCLYESLKRQTFRGFEWMIMDGNSADGTLGLLRKYSAESPWVRFLSNDDFGVYDALNKGIAAARGGYYVVAGADDVFDDSALAHYAEAAQKSGADVVLARVLRAGKVIGGFHPRRAWIGHSKAFPVSHSVGMLFGKHLHESIGWYSKTFPLLADGYFLKLLLNANAKFCDANFLAGTFAADGMSSVNKIQTLVETWHIQMLTERLRFFQTCLFLGKLIYKYPAVARELARSSARPSVRALTRPDNA